MEKPPLTIEKDLKRIVARIADIRYAEPPESLAEEVLARIKPKRTTLFKRLWLRMRTPVSVTPLRLLPAAFSALVILSLALSLLWRAPDERIGGQTTKKVDDHGLNTVMLLLDRPGATDVEVIGSFNNWAQEGVKMVWDKERGVWVVILHLRRGSYEYAFRINDEEIIADPKAILQRDDGFGHQNSILMIGNGNGNETRI
jgi:hypothetical protein